MLSEEENRTLTQVGPGTPMGSLLRRYWQPVAAVAELDEAPAKALRLLGEDLVLYRDGSGAYGLVSRVCAHRFGDLAAGEVEEHGLRCVNHGWLYDETGQCLEQPLEENSFAGQIQIASYVVAEKAGLLWAYLGPRPAPLVPDWEPFTWQDGLVQVVFSVLQCNWLQCHENSIDPDSEWLQAALDRTAKANIGPPPSDDQDIDFEEFDYGFLYRQAAKDRITEAEGWRVGRTSVWPNALFDGNHRSCHLEWYVPIDDRTTLSVAWFIDRVAPGLPLPEGPRVRHWYGSVRDERDEFITSHSLNRKYVMWVTQGMIFDRTREHLIEGDRGVVMLRNKLFSQLDLIADGGEPKSIIRDPRANQSLPLPFAGQAAVKGAGPGLEPLAPPPDAFPFLAGQPPEVEAAYKQVLATWKDQPNDGDSTS